MPPAPSPVAVTVVPVSFNVPPGVATTATASAPLVCTEPPFNVTVPPFSARTPLAKLPPEVATATFVAVI